MLFFLVALIFWLGLAFLGASMASARHRSAVGWFLVCLVVPFLGLLLLLILPDANAPQQVVIVERESANSSGDHTAHSGSPVMAQAAPSGTGSPAHGGNGYAVGHAVSVPAAPVALNSADMLRLPKPDPLEQWRYLVEYDPAIRAAASALGPLGPDAQTALREAFFALQDRALLPAIVARIQERGGIGIPPAPPQYATRAGSPPPNLTPNGPHNSADVHALPLARSNGASNNGAFNNYSAIRHGNGQTDSGQHAISGSTARNGHGDAHRNGSHPKQPLHTKQPLDVVTLRSSVSPQELVGATFVETYRGVHLFHLADGRIYIDRHVGMPALADARQLIDEARAASPKLPAQPVVVTSPAASPTALRA